MTLPLFESQPLMQGAPSKKLRPYQARAIVDVRAKVLMGVRRILCVGPTGCGKIFVVGEHHPDGDAAGPVRGPPQGDP